MTWGIEDSQTAGVASCCTERGSGIGRPSSSFEGNSSGVSCCKTSIDGSGMSLASGIGKLSLNVHFSMALSGRFRPSK